MLKRSRMLAVQCCEANTRTQRFQHFFPSYMLRISSRAKSRSFNHFYSIARSSDTDKNVEEFLSHSTGQDNSKGSGIFFILYKTFLICWISFGLGYIVMIMTFIARGMRSKKITRIEHKLATNLKHTQSKIWNEFNKEINYLRRVFNELQLSKVKVNERRIRLIISNFPFLFKSLHSADSRGLTIHAWIARNNRLKLNKSFLRFACTAMQPRQGKLICLISESVR